jgi:primosomal protein N' (replication factor Y)
MSDLLVSMAVPAPLPYPLDYCCPAAAAPVVGARAVVMLGNRRVVAVVLAVAPLPATADLRLKAVTTVLDRESMFDPVLLELLRFAIDYYHHPPGEVCSTALPTRLRSPEPFVMPPELAYALSDSGRLAQAAGVRGVRQQQVLDALLDGALPSEQLRAQVQAYAAALPSLLAKGWIERLELSFAAPPARTAVLPPLSEEQSLALQRIVAAQGAYQPILLEGVTGSGKTEVYLAAVAAVVSNGRQALLLVPEISLTPQFIARLRDRLNVRLGVLHSELGDGERAQAWVRAAQGQLDVVVGTRSALFTPLARLGLIVVDEEHDASYKQGEGFRYSARDLALKRGQLAGVPVVLGTATPALETLRHAQSGRYAHLRLLQRHAAARPPDLELVDLRQRPTFEGLSDLALTEIRDALEREEQVLVFRNQRGFAPVMICHDCGWHPQCLQCARPLTWHRREARLRCHHCGWNDRQPRACPQCSSLELRGQGVGTERLEQFLGGRFPNVPLIRMDRDSLARKGSLAIALQTIEKSTAALVVGTQMLAKGHHWPRVTRVVIVDVDSALFSVDFRAAERLAQLVVQVAGRAGRAQRPGRVLLQTHQPEHPLLQALLRGGYRAALAHESVERAAAEFPPFSALALIRCEARSMEAALQFLNDARQLQPAAAAVEVSSPMSAVMPMRAGLFRAQLWLQAADRGALQRDLTTRIPRLYALKKPTGLRWSLDVDPQELA